MVVSEESAYYNTTRNVTSLKSIITCNVRAADYILY